MGNEQYNTANRVPFTTLSVDTEAEDGKRISFAFVIKKTFLEGYLAAEGEGISVDEFVADHANDEAEDVYATALVAGEVLAIEHRHTGINDFIGKCHVMPLDGCYDIANGVNHVHIQKDGEYAHLYNVTLSQDGKKGENKNEHIGVCEDELFHLVSRLLWKPMLSRKQSLL
jgi:hypothetical protein